MACFWRLVSPHVLLFVRDLGCDPSSLRKRWALTKSKLCFTLFGMSRFDGTGYFRRENCELTLWFHSEQVLILNILASVLSMLVWYVLHMFIQVKLVQRHKYEYGWLADIPAFKYPLVCKVHGCILTDVKCSGSGQVSTYRAACAVHCT